MDEDLTLIWKALADPNRRKLLDILRERPHTTGELSAMFASSRFAVMKHLAVLEEAGLVTVRARGRERWHYLNVVPLQQVYERWLQPYEVVWADRLLQLKRQVEAKGAETVNEVTSNFRSIQIEQEVRIKASVAQVFNALVHEVDPWWDRNSRWSASSKVVIEPRVGGRFYEEWGVGNSALSGIVTRFEPDKVLEISGNHGMQGAVYGVVLYDLSEDEGMTVVKLSHHAHGEISERTLTNFAHGWPTLLDQLKQFVEHGKHFYFREQTA